MGRINSYPNVKRPERNDELLIDGSAGTRNVLMSDAAIELAGMISSDMHNNIIRGKNIGSSFTDAQKTAIRNRTFDDLYIGDFWTINGVSYRIADMNYWLNQGDIACVTSHLVIIPDDQLYTGKMNNTNTTTGGYMGSLMYKEGLNQAKNLINTAFGSNYILNHREFLSNAATDGHISGGAWVDSTIELPNEFMMYGCFARSMGRYDQTIDKNQLALMRVYTRWINPSRHHVWLRDIVSDSMFAHVHAGGMISNTSAGELLGVRPVFGIHG